jgi:hypothetical protein|nr:MAG TPA: hypothetical protein [Caudoviricetes sp.]
MDADTTFGKIQLMDDAQPFPGMELKRFRKELSNLSIRDLGFSPGLSSIKVWCARRTLLIRFTHYYHIVWQE